MAPSKPNTAEIMQQAADLPKLIQALEQEIKEVASRMAELEKAGLIYASEHWRKDSEGQPKYFYLLYPQKQGEARRREYVGCDQAKIEDARAGITRAKEFDELARKLDGYHQRVRAVYGSLHDARRSLTGQRLY